MSSLLLHLLPEFTENTFAHLQFHLFAHCTCNNETGHLSVTSSVLLEFLLGSRGSWEEKREIGEIKKYQEIMCTKIPFQWVPRITQ